MDPVMPIAIVGISGRFPGDAESPMKLWDMIAEGRSALSEIPEDRFNIDAFYHPNNERQGTITTRKAHFMKRDVSAFDAPFFSMPIAEARAMDPQHRMALECTYEALENAGIRMQDVQGSNTSCFVGCFTRDYCDMVAFDGENIPLYHGTGNGSAMISNRISWFFNMKGPSISLDTACSSSMAALHLGCQSLRTGESTMSIVGGTNVILLPDMMSMLSRLHFLSPDGKCQSFDHKGNGYARGEGAGFCVLKPLHLALKDGDVIRAVIRNSAVNQDGNTPGITVPSTEAQESLIRRVYAEAHLNMADTAYVEAHGTGTPAGDPVEAAALAATFGKERTAGNPLYIGSVKSNIGHLEGGSGLVQVIKAVMMLEKGQIPPSIWYEKHNPRIQMDDWNLAVPTQLMSWPVSGTRRISINSFGYGGTNAHCVMDDAYHYLRSHGLEGNHNVQLLSGTSSPASTTDSGVDMSASKDVNRLNLHDPRCDWKSLQGILGSQSTKIKNNTSKLLVWTSHDQPGIMRTAKMYHDYLTIKLASKSEEQMTDKEDQLILTKFARTLAARRSVFPWKTFAIVDSSMHACLQLENSAINAMRSTKTKTIPRIAFIFTGQGAQWFAMGRELLSQSMFRSCLEAAGHYLARLGAKWSLMAELLRDDASSQLDLAHVSQPICTALQIALIDLLEHWNIKPSAVVGHSSGEIAAAYVKGAITRENAWAIAYHRGHLSSCIRGFAPSLHGGMLATTLGPQAAQEFITHLHPDKGSAVIACVNSPSSTTLSGDSSAIEELESQLRAKGQFARKLKVDVAYHSPHMLVIADRYRQAIQSIVPLAQTKETQTVKMFSSLTGALINNEELGPEYWVQNMLGQVKFLAAVESMIAFSEQKSHRARRAYVAHLIEIGPHAALKGPLQQILNHESLKTIASNLTYHSVLQRGTDAVESALTLVGKLFQLGHPVDISAANNDHDAASGDFFVDMPTFSWNHGLKYWWESHLVKSHRFRKHAKKDLFGLETLERLPNEPRFRNIIRVADSPWVQHHKVQGSILYPAAGMMVAVIEAASQKAATNVDIAGFELRDVLIHKAIVVPDDDAGIETMLAMRPFRLGSHALTSVWQEFQLYSHREEWDLNCSGLILVKHKTEVSNIFADESKLKAEQYAAKYTQVLGECTRSQPSRQFYEHLDSIGLRYGDIFRNLTEIKKGDFVSACRLRIPDTKSIMPQKFEFAHVVHPTTLDSIIQMALPAVTPTNENLTVAMVPTSIGRLYISAELPSESGSMLSGYSYKDGPGGTVVVSDEKWSEALVVFEDIRSATLSVPTQGNTASIESLRKLTSVLHWNEDISMLEPGQIKKLCDENTGNIDDVDRVVLKELEIACLIFIKRILADCPPDEAKAYAWNFKLYWEYMQQCFNRGAAGQLCYQHTGDNWLGMTVEAEEALIDRVATTSADGAVLVEHCRNLPAILRGELPPLQILMRNNFLHDFYKSGLGTERHYAQIAFYVNLLAHKNPNMKILEIGGGTAGATLPVLESLGGQQGTAPRFGRYTFTDISVGYFEKAAEKLSPWKPFMEFAKLNIEDDPLLQGFEEGTYDLIIASNVLHATKFIGTTLTHSRKLLKPTGKLVLSEITNPTDKMRFHMIVGSLEGWWYGGDDGRKYTPTLNVSEWHSAMLGAGFSGVDIDFQNFPDPLDASLSVMVTTATKQSLPTPPTKIALIVPDSIESDVTSFAKKTETRLIAMGSEVTIVPLRNAANFDANGKSCLVLLDAGKHTPFLPEVCQDDWEALKRITLSSRNVTYVTRGGTVKSENPSSNLMSGMARSIRSENPGLGFATLDVDYNTPMDQDETIAAVLKVFFNVADAIEAEHPDWEFAIRNGMPMVQRVVLETSMNELCSTFNVAAKPQDALFTQQGRPLQLEIGHPGRLDTLRFNDDPSANAPLKDDEVEIEIKAAGLNFKDVMVAMGQLEQPALGVDCSGIVSRIGGRVKDIAPGDRVMTWKLGTFGNFTRCHQLMAQRIPDGMDFVTAASLPVIYSTSYHALFNLARLEKGETLLIHGAAGGVGQASIILAQHLGAEIYATVSSEKKKKLLISHYNIPEDHIFNSRDTQFAQAISRMTNGRGVDVILNSLAGEALRVTWHCIARFGRFIEMGQKDIVGNTGLDMAPFLRNVAFHSINLLDLLDHNVTAAAKVFSNVVDMLRKGIAKPIRPIVSMPFSSVEEAFRMMQTGKHIGKIVLEVVQGDVVSVIPPGVPPIQLLGNATYLITGGSGGLGRCIATWLAKSGARHIILLSRSGDKKPNVASLLVGLRKQGVRVEAWACDIGHEQQLLDCLARCKAESWPAIRGVIQGAMVLQDAIYQNMTAEQFLGATRCKVQGSWYLHEHLPKDLDFFVLLSSSVGIAGSRGQGNYSAGNAYQDAIAHYRRQRNLKACSIDVGMVLGVGFLVEETTDARVHENTKSWSFIGIRDTEFLGILQAAMTQQSIGGAKVPPQLITGLGTGGMMAHGAEKYPWWFNDAKFRHIVQVDTHQVVQEKNEGFAELRSQISQASSIDQAAEIVTIALVKKLAKSMLVGVEDIEPSRPVSSYGVDSLLAVELRAWIYSEIFADISVFDLLSNISITSLARKIVANSKALPEGLQTVE